MFTRDNFQLKFQKRRFTIFVQNAENVILVMGHYDIIL